jgi:hypothetical protein
MGLAEAYKLAKSDPAAFIEKHLEVQERETQRSIPFTLTHTQRRVHEELERMHAENDGIVRAVVLKARRQGVTSYSEARGMTEVMFRTGAMMKLIAHEEKATAQIFQMLVHYYESMVEKDSDMDIGFKKRADSRGWWIFNGGSQISVATAGSPEATRGSGCVYMHLSEVAFFPDAKRLMAAIGSLVPRARDTYVIVESTANGMDNYFATKWKEAVKNEEQIANGEKPWSDWRAIFIPWFDDPGCFVDRPLDDNLPLKDDKLEQFLEEEVKLRELYNLSDGQLAFRRIKIFSDYEGDIDQFRQEYPSNPEEAFIYSTGRTFDRHVLSEQYQRALQNPSPFADIGQIKGRVEIIANPSGLFEIHEYPKRGEPYLLVADASEGDTDPAGAQMWGLNEDGIMDEKVTYAQVKDPRAFAADLYLLGHAYNDCLICPERSAGPGRALIASLIHDVGWGNLWTGFDITRAKRPLTDMIGWPVQGQAAKEQIITQLAGAIRMGDIVFRSLHTIGQLLDYTKDDRGKYGPSEKEGHDDLVMCAAIAYSAWLTMPPVRAGDVGAVKMFEEPAFAYAQEFEDGMI